jgi:hypothetical protein
VAFNPFLLQHAVNPEASTARIQEELEGPQHFNDSPRCQFAGHSYRFLDDAETVARPHKPPPRAPLVSRFRSSYAHFACVSSVRRQKRSMDATMTSADFVQRNGLGAAFPILI